MNLPKPKKWTVKVTDLIAEPYADMQLEMMMQSILEAGGITTPIIVNGQLHVLNGKRRTLAGQQLVKDPNTPGDVLENLMNLRVIVYEDLTDEQQIFLSL